MIELADSGMVVSFRVPGVPRPQGSACWRPTRNGKVARIPNRASEHWRERVAAVAELAIGELPMIKGPVRVDLEFRLPRPLGHYGTGRNADALKAAAPTYPTGTPDVDKLTRAVLDGLTSTIFADDSQVVELVARKVYVSPTLAGVAVAVEVLG